MPDVDPALFRQLLGRFATGVTVVTAVDAQGRPGGMTASAIAAVSLNPPLLLVCVNRGTDFVGTLAPAATFAVNVLARDQESLSRRFAADGVDRFAGVPWTRGPAGVPLLEGVLAHVVCQNVDRHEAGDHSVFFGRVVGGQAFDRFPLVHFRGDYTSTVTRTES
ncbi:MAG TPA: flavin reductase family protein [Gemmatimonadales bacterium]|nr:flavin reductase family protein [Gemmatimonadales bacterium]